MTSKSKTKAGLKRHKQTLTFETAMYQALKFTDIDIDKDTTTSKAAEGDDKVIA